MSLSIRPLTRDHAAAVRRIGAEAFGFPASTDPPADPWPSGGTRAWGALVGDELVATVLAHPMESWFGGARVPTAGIAAVAVVPEHRGSGLLTPLFDAVLAEAREHGEVLSTLYGTAPGIYRRFGYEVVGEYTEVEVPTAALTRISAPGDVTLHRVSGTDPDATDPDATDEAAVHAVYDRWAAAQNGPLARRRHAERIVDGERAITLARDADGAPVGFAAWERRDGYDAASSTVHVQDMIAVTADAQRALWAMLGSFSSVTRTVALRTSGADTARLALPAAAWRPVAQWPYSLRLLDVPGAFAARGVGPLDVALPFAVAGDGLDGDYLLTARDGVATCERSDRAGPVFTGTGLALAYAAVQSCASLRFAGLLSGADGDDATWDALLGGRPFHVRDYF